MGKSITSEMLVSIDIGCYKHNIAIGLNDGKLLDEFEVGHKLFSFRMKTTGRISVEYGFKIYIFGIKTPYTNVYFLILVKVINNLAILPIPLTCVLFIC